MPLQITAQTYRDLSNVHPICKERTDHHIFYIESTSYTCINGGSKILISSEGQPFTELADKSKLKVVQKLLQESSSPLGVIGEMPDQNEFVDDVTSIEKLHPLTKYTITSNGSPIHIFRNPDGSIVQYIDDNNGGLKQIFEKDKDYFIPGLKKKLSGQKFVASRNNAGKFHLNFCPNNITNADPKSGAIEKHTSNLKKVVNEIPSEVTKEVREEENPQQKIAKKTYAEKDFDFGFDNSAKEGFVEVFNDETNKEEILKAFGSFEKFKNHWVHDT